MWLDPFCRNLELANQADHEDDLPENLSEITDLWNSPARTHVRAPAGTGSASADRMLKVLKICQSVSAGGGGGVGGGAGALLLRRCLLSHRFFRFCLWPNQQGTFGREPQAKPEDDRYLRAAIQEYDNIAKLGQIMREGPIKVRQHPQHPHTHTHTT